MRLLICCLAGIFLPEMLLFSQKPMIDTSCFNKWEYVTNADISSNGKFMYYDIHDSLGNDNLFVESVDKTWKQCILNSISGRFTDDSKYFSSDTGDSCRVYSLSEKKLLFAVEGKSFTIIESELNDWLIYLEKTGEKFQLKITDLVSMREIVKDSITWFCHAPVVPIIVMRKESEETGVSKLEWYNLQTGQSSTIFKGRQPPPAVIFDHSGKQCVFLLHKNVDGGYRTASLWYFKEGIQSAECIVNDSLVETNSFVAPSFSVDDRRVLFYRRNEINNPLANKAVEQNIAPGNNVVIWNFKSKEIRIDLKNSSASPAIGRSLLTVYDLATKKIMPVENNGSEYLVFGSVDIDDYLVLFQSQKDSADHSEKYTYYLASIATGDKTLITATPGDYSRPFISSAGKFVCYYDKTAKQLKLYSIQKKTTISLPHDALPAFVGWMKGDKALFVNDSYSDIWKIDPEGNRLPICITNRYAKKNDIQFRILNGNGGFIRDGEILKDLNDNSRLVLLAFSEKTKQSGFYSITLSKPQDPLLLNMDQWMYQADNSSANFVPHKAKNAETWLVRRESSSFAPNFFVTNDLKNFKQITNVQPQQKYNWLTSELIEWKMLDGSVCQGVLYKPENFDASKKYPVIFNYYQKESDNLNLFQEPKASEGNMNVPWFVSHGYLVFTPDINFIKRHPGRSAFESVVSAAKYLKRFSFIDSTKLGLQGHSFGGYHTNYIISHSNLFAAAVEASGVSDLVSEYLSPRGKLVGDNLSYFEDGQGRMQVPFWKDKQAWLDESAVYNVDKVTTPLLMMHTAKDASVNWQQGIEFFTALQHLDKKVWMLVYPEANHNVFDKDALDYTMRMTQFFDYYLKGAPAPKWMTTVGEKSFELDNDSGKR